MLLPLIQARFAGSTAVRTLFHQAETVVRPVLIALFALYFASYCVPGPVFPTFIKSGIARRALLIHSILILIK